MRSEAFLRSSGDAKQVVFFLSEDLLNKKVFKEDLKLFSVTYLIFSGSAFHGFVAAIANDLSP